MNVYRIKRQDFSDKLIKISLPGSKSESNRMLIIEKLIGEQVTVSNLSESDDTVVMNEALRGSSHSINVGIAGTAMRFLTALYAITPGEWMIEGSERMHERPIDSLVDALRSLGADIEYLSNEGFPPLKINGKPLEGGEVKVNSPSSSQFVSALMLIAPYLKKGLTIYLEGDVVSQPYIDMTSGLMWEYQIEVQFSGKKIMIPPGVYENHPHIIESDWSAAGYWYAIWSFIHGKEIEMDHLRMTSLQGDKKIVELYKNFGIETRFGRNKIILCNFKQVTNYFKHDFKDEPDQVQTFVVLCAAHRIKARFSGLQTLYIKETDRVLALQKELKKFGVEMNETTPGYFELQYTSDPDKNVPIRVKTYGDHRMAMAFSIWAAAGYIVEIEDPEVVTKSYPDFWKHLPLAGLTIEAVEA